MAIISKDLTPIEANTLFNGVFFLKYGIRNKIYVILIPPI